MKTIECALINNVLIPKDLVEIYNTVRRTRSRVASIKLTRALCADTEFEPWSDLKTIYHISTAEDPNAVL